MVTKDESSTKDSFIKTDNQSEKTITKIKKWILASTSHGLPSIFRTDQTYLKVIWFIAFLVSTIGCAFVVVQFLITFFQYNVTVSTKFEITTPIDFPAITICNLNPFHTPRAMTFINATISKNNLTNLLTLFKFGSKINALKLANIFLSTLKTSAATDPNLNATSREALGFYMDEMIISCTYSGSDCSSGDFVFLQSFDYGNCYTFNSGYYANGTKSTIQQISSSGPATGLEIELFAGQSNNELYIYKRGFYVIVHNQSSTPIMDNEGIHISVGMQTNIGINRLFYYKLSSPYSTCIEDTTSSSSSNSVLYQSIMNQLQEKSYRQKYCYKLCYQHYVIESCSCYDPAYPNPFPSFGNNTINTCRNVEQAICKTKAQSKFETMALNSKCAEDCPEECTKISYSTSLSTATYPTDFYLDWLLSQNTLINKFSNKTSLSSQIKNSIAKINIFYNDISDTVLSETATLAWDALLGNIGGQLGLFIGISFLSLIEIIEICFEIIRTIFLHKMTARKVHIIK